MIYLMLPNGEMMYTRTRYFGLAFVGRRITRDQIKEHFWLPAAADEAEAKEEDKRPLELRPLMRAVD